MFIDEYKDTLAYASTWEVLLITTDRTKNYTSFVAY